MTERVRAAIAEMPIPLSDGRSILVTASFGIVVAPDALVHAADEALYRAKAAGRNRVVVSAGFSPLPSP